MLHNLRLNSDLGFQPSLEIFQYQDDSETSRPLIGFLQT